MGYLGILSRVWVDVDLAARETLRIVGTVLCLGRPDDLLLVSDGREGKGELEAGLDYGCVQ